MRAHAFLLIAMMLLAGCALPEVPKDPTAPGEVPTPGLTPTAPATPTPAGPESPRRITVYATHDEAARQLVVTMRIDGDRGTPLVLAGTTTIVWTDTRSKELLRTEVETADTDFTTQERRGDFFPGVAFRADLSAFARSDGWQGSELTAAVTHVLEDGRVLRGSARVTMPLALMDQSPSTHTIELMHDRDASAFLFRAYFSREGRTIHADGEGTLRVHDGGGALLLEETWSFKASEMNQDIHIYRGASVERTIPLSSFKRTEHEGPLRLAFTATLPTGVTNATGISRDAAVLAPALADRARLTIVAVGTVEGQPYADLRFENVGRRTLSFCGSCFTAKTAEGLVYNTYSPHSSHPAALESGARYEWREVVQAPAGARIVEVIYKSYDPSGELRANAP